MIDEMRNKVRRMLLDGDVRLFIGYGVNGMCNVTPVFLRRGEDADRLVWNGACCHNLSRYLADGDVIAVSGGKVGVLVKGCDQKAIKVLLSESRFSRETVAIVGVICDGMRDTRGRSLKKCENCSVKVPDVSFCDVVVGAVNETVPSEKGAEEHAGHDDFSDLSALESLTPAGRREFWRTHFQRCIRCYACRNICPLCYCKECVLDQRDPEWVPQAPSAESNMFFHIIRAYHLAGRCVDCGECERVCPMKIPLGLINRRLIKAVKKGYGFEAGRDPGTKSPLTWFRQDDPESIIDETGKKRS